MKKKIIHILSGIFPKRFVDYAYYKLTHPQVHKLRPHEKEVIGKANKQRFQFNEFDIQLYEWKAGPQKVMLIHGWGGQAGNFADLIERLVAKNITVLAFDGPSHGNSSKGKGSTSLFEFAELVGVLVEHFQVSKLVSHSFGGVATTYSLSQKQHLEIDKYALFTTPDRFADRISVVAEQAGLHNKVKKKLITKLELELKLDLSILNVSNFVKGISVKEAFIVHDTFDKVLSVEESKRVVENWTAATLEEVRETGHFRILRTDDVLTKVISFLEFD